MKQLTTIKDIAHIAGLSHSPVSRSLNDHPSIFEQDAHKM
ncbi:MAG: LacI family DNA-binding transcriptional regulator [Salinispira sp.]